MPGINWAEASGALDLPKAAMQYFGVSTWITLGTTLLISTAAFVVMRLYLRTVFRESQRSSSHPQDSRDMEDVSRQPLPAEFGPLEIETETPCSPAKPLPPRSPTFRHAETAFRHAVEVMRGRTKLTRCNG